MTPTPLVLAPTPLGQWVVDHAWAFPALEVVHTLGIIVLVGSVVLVDLRVLGAGRRLAVDDLARAALPWALLASAVVAPSGMLMFASDALAYLGNRVFMLKLSLILAAVINAVMFHLGPFSTVAQWRLDAVAPLAARLHAGASLLLWAAVATCGRLVAYT